jgi:hypothetical protein
MKTNAPTRRKKQKSQMSKIIYVPCMPHGRHQYMLLLERYKNTMLWKRTGKSHVTKLFWIIRLILALFNQN